MDINNFISQLNAVITETGSNEVAANSEQVVNNITVSSHTESETVAPPKSVKILIVGTHTNQINGYSKVLHNIINQLSSQSWISITHFATQKLPAGDLGRKYPNSVKVIDGTALDKNKNIGFAFAELPQIITSEKPDVVFIYNDLAITCGYLEEIRKSKCSRTFKVWTYLDLVSKPFPQGMIDILSRDVDRVFCFTKSWKDQLKQQKLTRPVDVLNHGVDTRIFRTIPRELARSTLGLPKDVFMITSLNKNIPRKRLDLLISAFVKLIVRFPMKPIFMLLVADKGAMGGYPLFEIFENELKHAGGAIETFGTRLLITENNRCYKDDDVNLLYNCGDIGVSCAEGEGFGLCTFEQMALGIPQIVPNINGYNEYCNNSNSIMIEPTIRGYIPHAHSTVTGEALIVDPEDVSKAMEKYLFDEDLRKLHGNKGKESVKEYSWNNVCSILIKRLKEVGDNDD
jgi:glycosyltransferase involved in cell wall biosynthesis